MDTATLRIFLTDVERATMLLREADAAIAEPTPPPGEFSRAEELLARGASIEPAEARELLAARTVTLTAEAARLIARIFGPQLAEARDWLAKPQRDLLDEKIAAMEPWRARLAA